MKKLKSKKNANGTGSIIDVARLAYFYSKLPKGGVPPVGAYLDLNVKRNPALDYPGTSWTQVNDGRVLVAGNSTATGGSNTLTQTENQVGDHHHFTSSWMNIGNIIGYPNEFDRFTGTLGGDVYLAPNNDHFNPILAIDTSTKYGEGSMVVECRVKTKPQRTQTAMNIQQAYQTTYRYRRTA